MLPFTREHFLAVFAQYNVAIWPLLIGGGLATPLLWHRGQRRASPATT